MRVCVCVNVISNHIISYDTISIILHFSTAGYDRCISRQHVLEMPKSCSEERKWRTTRRCAHRVAVRPATFSGSGFLAWQKYQDSTNIYQPTTTIAVVRTCNNSDINKRVKSFEIYLAAMTSNPSESLSCHEMP